MNQDKTLLEIKLHQAIERGVRQIPPEALLRLEKSRQAAVVAFEQTYADHLRIASLGGRLVELILPASRQTLAICALLAGMVFSYYINTFIDAEDLATVDTELLSDDLPIDAYTDQGFHAWIGESSQH